MDVSVLFGDAEVEVQDCRDWWNDRTEKWQESERGMEQDESINELEELTDAASDVVNALLEHLEGMK
ncbi:MAG: hypothetical protein V3S33_03525 [Gammaproteobacteria bacterium]